VIELSDLGWNKSWLLFLLLLIPCLCCCMVYFVFPAWGKRKEDAASLARLDSLEADYSGKKMSVIAEFPGRASVVDTHAKAVHVRNTAIITAATVASSPARITSRTCLDEHHGTCPIQQDSRSFRQHTRQNTNLIVSDFEDGSTPRRSSSGLDDTNMSSFSLFVRCSFLDRILHSRMPSDPTHVHLKRTCL
jgi:hypothetical protein